MPSPFKSWTVLPHGKLGALDTDVLTVVGEIPMPLGKLPRRMTVVRLADSRLVIYSAIALDEPQMQELEAFGRPAFLVVPSDIHRMDAAIWKQRYPGLTVVAPAAGRAKIATVVQVDATAADLGDPAVRLVDVEGTGRREFALEVEGPAGTTLIVNDAIANIRDASGMAGWFLRLMKFAGDRPHVPRPVRMKLIRDKAAFRRQLARWADLPDLRRIVVSHGAVIDQDPAGTLRRLAASLD